MCIYHIWVFSYSGSLQHSRLNRQKSFDLDFLQGEINNQTWQKSLPVSKWPSKWKNGPDNAFYVITGFRLQLMLGVSIGIAWLEVVFLVLQVLFIVSGPVTISSK